MTIAQALPGRRFAEHISVGNPSTLAPTHPAVVEGTTRYRKTVRPASSAKRVLKSGQNSKKIGGRITKGRWAGMPIFTLTLEERATCPRSCLHWRNCYGNKMHWAHRFEHGPELEVALEKELEELNAAHPTGFVVRLHVLGDFYSVEYVARWEEWLVAYPALRVFGYTAHDVLSPIGSAIRRLRDADYDRFAVRTSNGGLDDACTLSLGSVQESVPFTANATICPAQTQRTDCCATCGLCWQSRSNIIFLEH